MRRARFQLNDESNFEINLAPMLDIIVSIVPMLLLSVVFFKVTVIDTKVPQPTSKPVAEEKKKDRDVTLKLAISHSKGMDLSIVENGKENRVSVSKTMDEGSYGALKAEILRLKQKYPEVFQIELNPEEDVSYSEIVKVMDRVRSRSAQDPKISFMDKETGKAVETDLLFPDIVFANVAGG